MANKEFRSPVYNIIAVPFEKIVPNTYNPNNVAPPEMRLLYDSIKEDGYTMPCVCYYIPEKDIYETLLGRYGLKAEESVFLDDRAENCEAARQLGIHAIQFHDFKQAVAELEKLGIK